jgi:hypothetical protein
LANEKLKLPARYAEEEFLIILSIADQTQLSSAASAPAKKRQLLVGWQKTSMSLHAGAFGQATLSSEPVNGSLPVQKFSDKFAQKKATY